VGERVDLQGERIADAGGQAGLLALFVAGVGGDAPISTLPRAVWS
jgi:hypothetical protein